MNAREITLNTLYNARRNRLVGRYAAKFNSVGADAEDALAKAFESTARFLLGREKDFTADEFEKLICGKMNFLFKDALAGSKREHGRRSVKAVAILDATPDAGDDYRVALIDKVSEERYFGQNAKEGDENRFFLLSKAIDCVLAWHGKSKRDRDIFDRCFRCKPNRTALAAEMKTSVSNVGRVNCECSQIIVRYAPEVRQCYATLSRRYELEAC